MKNVMVLGSTGMVGHVVVAYMKQQGYQVYGISQSEINSHNSRKIDVTEFDKVSAYIEETHSEVVVNCVGLLQNACNERPDKAVLINSYLPHYLENCYKNKGVKIVHLSTDCVFSGDRGNYTEDDIPDGKSYYDRSKALGEIVNEKDLTFRMSIIGPDRRESGTGLFNWFMKQSGTVCGYQYALWNGVTSLELAEAIVRAVETDLCGLYHLVPEDTISKYELLVLIQRIFDKSDVEIKENISVRLNKCLINSRTDFSYKVKGYEEQIGNMRCWIEHNGEGYPGYIKRS